MDQIRRVEFLKEEDFDLIKKHYLRRTKELLQDSSSNLVIAEKAKRAYYLQCFVDDMNFFGYPEIATQLEKALAKDFGDSKVLLHFAEECLSKIKDKSDEEIKLGENTYFIKDKKIHYHSILDRWFTIEDCQAFMLVPELKAKTEVSLPDVIKPDRFSDLFAKWGTLDGAETFSPFFCEGETTPEKYFEISVQEIEKIINSPIRLQPVLDQFKDPNQFEKVFKVSVELIQFVQEIREGGYTPIYLLRDGLMFAEAQKALDFALGEETLSAQVMIGRKLLSKNPGDEFYWALSADALYAALHKSGGQFDKFYHDYCQEMSKIEKLYPEFKLLLDKLGKYVSEQTNHLRGKANKLLVVDTGLQGSINMLTKYIIDKHSDIGIPTDIKIFVAGDWFKSVYEGRYASDYYPIMKDIEIFNRSENLYKYKAGSFENGELKVVMGSRADQTIAFAELVVIAMVSKLLSQETLPSELEYYKDRFPVLQRKKWFCSGNRKVPLLPLEYYLVANKPESFKSFYGIDYGVMNELDINDNFYDDIEASSRFFRKLEEKLDINPTYLERLTKKFESSFSKIPSSCKKITRIKDFSKCSRLELRAIYNNFKALYFPVHLYSNLWYQNERLVDILLTRAIKTSNIDFDTEKLKRLKQDIIASPQVKRTFAKVASD